MKDKTKLLCSYGQGVAAIFFPPGTPKGGGTCGFSTRKCLKYCEAGEPNEFERQVYKFILSNSPIVVCDQILTELKIMGCGFLFWFAAGDCLPKDSDKILTIMKHLSVEDIIQHGFSRNFEFVQDANQISKVSIVLSVESVKKAQEMVSKFEIGVVAKADYKKDIVDLYTSVGCIGSCGGYFMEDKLKEVTRENSCAMCYDEQVGCFNGV